MAQEQPHEEEAEEVAQEQPHEEEAEEVAQEQPHEEEAEEVAQEQPHEEEAEEVAQEQPHEEEAEEEEAQGRRSIVHTARGTRRCICDPQLLFLPVKYRDGFSLSSQGVLPELARPEAFMMEYMEFRRRSTYHTVWGRSISSGNDCWSVPRQGVYEQSNHVYP